MLQVDFSIFPTIHTSRLQLRKIILADAPEILNLRSDEHVMRFIGKEKAASIADAEIFINRIIHALDIKDGITWGMALEENPDKLIGTIGYWRMEKEHYRAEIGYMLNPLYWQKGFMKEALMAILDMGFNLLKLHTIEARINPDNVASANLLLSTGFVKEAHLKENFYFDGLFSDTAIYTKFKQVY